MRRLGVAKRIEGPGFASTKDVNIKNIFFIDDSKTNVQTAQALGINAIQHKDWPTTEAELAIAGIVL